MPPGSTPSPGSRTGRDSLGDSGTPAQPARDRNPRPRAGRPDGVDTRADRLWHSSRVHETPSSQAIGPDYTMIGHASLDAITGLPVAESELALPRRTLVAVSPAVPSPGSASCCTFGASSRVGPSHVVERIVSVWLGAASRRLRLTDETSVHAPRSLRGRTTPKGPTPCHRSAAHRFSRAALEKYSSIARSGPQQRAAATRSTTRPFRFFADVIGLAGL